MDETEYRWREILGGQRPAEVDDIQRWADRQRAGERLQVEAAAARKMEAASGIVSEAIQLLLDADHSWNTVSGTVRSWADEEVLDIGRGLYHRSHDGPDDEEEAESAGLEDGEPEPDRWEVQADFLAAQPPLRLRLERFRHGVASKVSGPRALIATPRRYAELARGRVKVTPASPPRILHIPGSGELWSAYEDGVERGEGGNVTYGIENLDTLLRPAVLVRAFDFTAATRTIEGGRDAIALSAVRDPSDDFLCFGGGLVALGPAAYTITIDATYGIILAWIVHINEMLGSSQTLTQVQFDRPIDESVFAIAE